MELIYPFTEHQQRYQRSLCLHPVSEPLFLCFIEHHYSCNSFLGGDYTLVVFAPSSLCVWSQIPWRNLWIRVSSQGFLHGLPLWFDRLPESVMLWITFSEIHFDSSQESNMWNLSCWRKFLWVLTSNINCVSVYIYIYIYI